MLKRSKYSLKKMCDCVAYSCLFVYNIIGEYILEVSFMYLKRKIDTYLMNWKNSENRKPLIMSE